MARLSEVWIEFNGTTVDRDGKISYTLYWIVDWVIGKPEGEIYFKCQCFHADPIAHGCKDYPKWPGKEEALKRWKQGQHRAKNTHKLQPDHGDRR